MLAALAAVLPARGLEDEDKVLDECLTSLPLGPDDNQHRAPRSVARRGQCVGDPRRSALRSSWSEPYRTIAQLLDDGQHEFCVMVISPDVVNSRADKRSATQCE